MPIDKLRTTVAGTILCLGAMSLSSCSNETLENTPQQTEIKINDEDIQKQISDFIGKQYGIYDEEGNVIPRESHTFNTD